MTLLVLRAPSANRVYAQAAGPLALQEARWVLGAHLPGGAEVRERTIAGIDYLEIRTDAPREDLVPLVSTLSSVLALFGVPEPSTDIAEAPPIAPGGASGPVLLEPVARDDSTLSHPDDLETTLRYPGKTNEQFTAMLLNLATAASGRRERLAQGTLAVLDPMCGRGTTLSRALRLGLSPIGADIDSADIDAYRAFLLTWLRTHRLKHTSRTEHLTVHGRRLGSRSLIELAANSQARRAREGQELTLLRCDTAELGQVLRRASIDALVADLPYGVQHGATAHGRLHRSPLEVLDAVAGTWRSLLRTDGAMALAFNRRTAPFPEVAGTLEAAGMRVVSADGAYRHRVDQSIERDVILAIPTAHPQADALAVLGGAADERKP